MALCAAVTSPVAAAQGFVWADGYDSRDIYVDAPRPVRPMVRRSVIPKGAEKAEKLANAGRKPEGPLVVAISIQHQNVKVYDTNGLFAESPISSGMAGHSTPMGVFSIIQRSKYHRSNIYSGAPMPYMQRITWSGIALHAGVLPGYPASHGCIRMPMSFAMKMWGWTRMGARVVVTPGEVSPSAFQHPVLDALVPPSPVAQAPTPATIRTADATGSFGGGPASVMIDSSVEAAPMRGLLNDVASVASVTGTGVETDGPAANDGMPPAASPVAIDLSDIEVTTDAVQPSSDVAAAAPAPAPVDSIPSAPAEPFISPTDGGKDQAALPPTQAEPAVALAPLMKRNMPVAIFVSRKDGKIYVRQNFAPVLDMPIEIAASDKPLGTHVFTAHAAGEDKKLQWSVVTMPSVGRQTSATHDDSGRRRQAKPTAVMQTAADTPAEALARLTIPADLMAQLGEALPNGSSLVVSDQGIAQGESGQGTDFIVRLR